MGSTLFLDLLTAPLESGILRLMLQMVNFYVDIPLAQCMHVYLPNQMQKVGSKTHRVGYYIGCPQTIIKPCILLPL
jgi:hypothetical protein